MKISNHPRYKADYRVSNFEVNLENIKKLYIYAVNSKHFWSGADKIKFEGIWTKHIIELLFCGNSDVLGSFRHRLTMDEEGEM